MADQKSDQTPDKKKQKNYLICYNILKLIYCDIDTLLIYFGGFEKFKVGVFIGENYWDIKINNGILDIQNYVGFFSDKIENIKVAEKTKKGLVKYFLKCQNNYLSNFEQFFETDQLRKLVNFNWTVVAVNR